MGYLFLMMIRSKYSGPEFPKETRIRQHHTSRFAFNFSFLTQDSKYNLDKSSKTIGKGVRLKLLDRINQLSQNDKVVILNLDRREGLEKLLESNVKLRIHPDFKSSKRYDECDDDFWVFRLAKLGRVIGKINENIFYIMSIDASFDQYNHGS